MTGTGVATTVVGLAVLSGGALAVAGETGVVETILEAHPEWFAEILARADEHRLQILYTRIDRDAANRPTFRSHGYRLTKERYFYPASAIKLPAPALALEKLNSNRRRTGSPTRSC